MVSGRPCPRSADQKNDGTGTVGDPRVEHETDREERDRLGRQVERLSEINARACVTTPAGAPGLPGSTVY